MAGADIGVGDWVECIAEDALRCGFCTHVGAVYQVTAIHADWRGKACAVHGPGCRHDIFDLAGMYDPFQGFCAGTFVPIYRPKSSLIESLLQGIDHLIPADRDERANAVHGPEVRSGSLQIAGCNPPIEHPVFAVHSRSRGFHQESLRDHHVTASHLPALHAIRLQRGEP